MSGLMRRLYYWVLRRKQKSYIDRLVRSGLKLGANCTIHDGFFFDPSHCYLISIGANCEFAPNVRLIAHDASPKNAVGYAKIGRVDIGSNCFLGDSVIVLPGVTIGENSIIGAGAVVTKDVPTNSVAAGNPARVICSVQAYAEKIRFHSANKKVFGTDYYIECLDDGKRAEVLAAVADDIGYMS
jgi:maltose O-acetyltransferase